VLVHCAHSDCCSGPCISIAVSRDCVYGGRKEGEKEQHCMSTRTKRREFDCFDFERKSGHQSGVETLTPCSVSYLIRLLNTRSGVVGVFLYCFSDDAHMKACSTLDDSIHTTKQISIPPFVYRRARQLLISDHFPLLPRLFSQLFNSSPIASHERIVDSCYIPLIA